MNMMYLLLKLGSAIVLMPSAYPEEQCKKIVENYQAMGRYAECIMAPRDKTKLDLFNEKYKDCSFNNGPLHCPNPLTLPNICEGDCMKADK